MEEEYNKKRLNPPFWQHDYHVLTRLKNSIQKIIEACISSRNNLILDYGCGTMPYRIFFQEYCSQYVGVDIGRNKMAQILIKEEEQIPQKDNSVDIVISTQVLEHVKNSHYYLSQCRRLLKKSGLLIISTHGLWPYHAYPSDYRRYTRRGLIAELETYGFKSMDVYPILGPFASVTQFTMLLIAEKLSSRGLIGKLLLMIISLIGNLFIYIENKLFPPDKNSDSSVYLICAKKK